MVTTEFEAAEPRVTEADGPREGGCNVYGCGVINGYSGKVWVVDLGHLVVRLCRRHAREVRRQLPSR